MARHESLPPQPTSAAISSKRTIKHPQLYDQKVGEGAAQAVHDEANRAQRKSQTEYENAKTKWVASTNAAIAAQRAIVAGKTAKDDDQEYLEQLEEQRTQILAVEPDPACTDGYKEYYTDLSSDDVDKLWNSSFGLRQAYMMYDFLSSMVVIEENFNDLDMHMVTPIPGSDLATIIHLT